VPVLGRHPSSRVRYDIQSLDVFSKMASRESTHVIQSSRLANRVRLPEVELGLVNALNIQFNLHNSPLVDRLRG